jgi:transcriptional regulator with XRE-family HTH domain
MDGQAFARAFGDALLRHLEQNRKTQATAAQEIGIDRARLNTYVRDARNGKRAVPSAEVLYMVCNRLGFEFEYMGCKISSSALESSRSKHAEESWEQLTFDFSRQFELTGNGGHVSISVRRPVGKVEVSVALNAAC